MAQIKQRGSLEQFMNVVRNRIEDLSGEPVESSFKYPEDMEDLENGEYESHVTEPVNASESVQSAMYQDMDGSTLGDIGTTATEEELRRLYDELHDSDPVVSDYDSFEDWLDDTVNNGYLKKIAGSESVEAAEEDDDEYDENAEYIQALIGDLESEIVGRHGDVIESIVFDDDDETLYMTVTFEHNGETSINDYEIPFEDLSMDPESMEDDVNYIADQVDVDMSDLED